MTAAAVATIQGAGAVQSAEKIFSAFVDEWFNSDEMFRVREQSKESYRKSLKAFCAWTAERGIEHPTKQDVKDWCKAMDAADLSVSTKNLRLTTLRNFYKWLASQYGVTNVADGLKGWKDDKEHKRGFLSCDEMRKLLEVVEPTVKERIDDKKKELDKKKKDAEKKGETFNGEKILRRFEETERLQGKRDKAILAVMMCGGLRTIEINRLRIGDVKKSGGVCYLSVIGKGKDTGVLVKISRKAEALIRDWLAAREVVDIVSNSSPLFCSLGNNSFGEPLSSNSVSTLCKKYLTAAKLKSKEVVAHSLRHSMATNSLLKGASLMEVQQQLRHVHLNTTQIYLHEAQKAANRCTDIIADSIF